MWKVQPFFPLLLLPCLAYACLVCSLSPPGHTFLHCTQISMLVRQWLHVMEIIDFKCKSDPLGNKEKVCPCHFCSCRCHEQMSRCRSRVSCSATSQCQESWGAELAHFSVGASTSLAHNPVICLQQWLCLLRSATPSLIQSCVWLLSYFWWGDSTHLCLCVLFLCFTIPCTKSCHIF